MKAKLPMFLITVRDRNLRQIKSMYKRASDKFDAINQAKIEPVFGAVYYSAKQFNL